jgi:hypothetical protein
MPYDRHGNAGFMLGEDMLGPASAQDYRGRATRLRALAVDSPDMQVRTYLLTTAAQFDRLADYATARAG